MHVAIGNAFEKILPKSCRLIRDEACGGKQRIPLFSTLEKSRKTEFCNVDLLVLKANKIKIIVEIEESNVKPTQICGKFLTSALAQCYIHESGKNKPIEMDDSVTFIQIVDTSKLVKDKTAKFNQWKGLEKSINRILPLKDSRITTYKLFYGSESDFNSDVLKSLFTS
jgi:hypothetical protein